MPNGPTAIQVASRGNKVLYVIKSRHIIFYLIRYVMACSV